MQPIQQSNGAREGRYLKALSYNKDEFSKNTSVGVSDG
jgi:hypothetical protein